jgi:hypothetical protein
MAEVSIGEGARRALSRVSAAGVFAALLAAFWGWLWVFVLGLGQLFSSTDDGACQQPEYLYGGALVVLALGGCATGLLGARRAGMAAVGRTAGALYGRHVVVTVLLALAAAETMTVLKPDFTFVPGAC